ncbi:MAG: hypothetical protein KDD44_04735 [Bdellovibrionales bacterium]|nr:hypothetical protein [Bdellovibrionales bacterium]
MQRLVSSIAADAVTSHGVRLPPGDVVGKSRAGRPIRGYRIGRGKLKISLLSGCHADEPVGSRLLEGFIAALTADKDLRWLLDEFEWWILPHINPDGAVANQEWQRTDVGSFDIGDYLLHVERELPGEDIEFGFSCCEGERPCRPENQAAIGWWKSDPRPFSLHVSLHGMAFAAGPWFLVEPAWQDRLAPFMTHCRAAVEKLGYRLHDVERQGEKGFQRLAPGFCTRPNSKAMREFFLERDEPATAALFRPSSMEWMRSFGGDPLTLVSEMPLFLLPDVGKELGPPDPAAERWHRQLSDWRKRVRATHDAEELRRKAAEAGLQAMPIDDQMALQWKMIALGCDTVRGLLA